METTSLNRRDFLVNSATAIGGFIVAFHMPSPFAKVLAATEATVKNNAFIRIAPDNTITLMINRLEMGQGVHTSMAQLIAEELEVDWKKIKSESSDGDKVYADPKFHMVMTGGSSALKNSWEQYRGIGAGMREVLMTAAANRWNVSVKEVTAKEGFIHHPKKGKLSYGELANEANLLPFPEKAALKTKNFKVIGKSQKRVDALAKSNGTAIFGMDVRIPGMLYATIARPSISTAKLDSFDASAAKKVQGVKEVFKIRDNLVVVVATNTFAAKEGQEALGAKWKDKLGTDSDKLMAQFKEAATKPAPVAKNAGNAQEEMKKAVKTISYEYEFPFLAHASMEPLNCTINYNGESAELWAGFQMPTMDQGAAANALGLKPEQVKLNVTYAGGSFGRRASKDSEWVIEACLVAKELKQPVKVVWTRENDMHAGYYRPLVYHKVEIGLNDKNDVAAWNHHIVGQSILKGSPFESFMIKDGIEAVLVEGVSDTRYNLPQFRVEQSLMDTPVKTLWWRSVGHTHTAYVMETLMDEMATQKKADPLEFRLNLLKGSPRHVEVLKLLKKKTNFGKAKIPKGRAWGLAIHESFDSVVGHVVEVSMENNQPKVHKVWSAVHCGQVVNPDGAKTQIEGGIVFGLSAALYQQIDIKDGVVQQSNYDQYEVVRMNGMPEVSVSFVESQDPPTGLGEPGVPPLAPAVANAVYQLTGKRIRKLPFSKELKA